MGREALIQAEAEISAMADLCHEISLKWRFPRCAADKLNRAVWRERAAALGLSASILRDKLAEGV